MLLNCCRHENPDNCTSEDDGYLITYVHDENTTTTTNSSSGSSGSSLVVWDAASMAQQPLAVVALPQCVPYGFHGLWATEGQLQQQLRSQPLQPTSLAG
jgi:carotenoid cleavage dioxygenase-like enzyme